MYMAELVGRGAVFVEVILLGGLCNIGGGGFWEGGFGFVFVFRELDGFAGERGNGLKDGG